MAASRPGSRFLFGTDFGEPAAPGRAEAGEAELRAAAAESHARGVAEGRRQAEAEAATRLADAVERLAAAAGRTLAELDGQLGSLEADAALFFRTLAEAWAGATVAAEPLHAVSAAADEAFRHMRGVAHLVVRVAPDLVEPVENLMKARGREAGFEGRLIVLGDEDARPGDVRIEWADGGIVRDRATIERAVEAVLARTIPDHRSSDGERLP